MCQLTTTYYNCDCVKGTKLALCPGMQNMSSCARAQYPVERLAKRCVDCRRFDALHQQSAAIHDRISAIHAQSRAKYRDFKRTYQDMQQAMQQQRTEEVDRLSDLLSHLEIEHQMSVERLTDALQEHQIDARENLDEQTTSMVCDAMVQEMKKLERADHVAVEQLRAQARELEDMARRNLKPIGTQW